MLKYNLALNRDCCASSKLITNCAAIIVPMTISSEITQWSRLAPVTARATKSDIRLCYVNH